MSDFDDYNRELFKFNINAEMGEDTIHKRNGNAISPAGFRASWDYTAISNDFAQFGEQSKRRAIIIFSRTDTPFPVRNDIFINSTGENYTVVDVGQYDAVSVSVAVVLITDVTTGHLKIK